MKNFLSHPKTLDPKPSSSDPSWPCSCGNVNTESFRSTNPKPDIIPIFNFVFLDSDSFSTVSSCSRTFSTMSEDSSDAVVRGLRSDRLFFEPERSSSLVCTPLKEEEDEGEVYKESEMLSMESENPYEDFRRSMEEMVEAHGLKDWEGVEELVKCYLKINGKSNHGYIMAAFIHLLVSFNFEYDESSSSSKTKQTTSSSSSSSSSCLSTNSNNCSPSSPLSLPSSSLNTPCLSSSLDHDDHDDHNDGDDDNEENVSS